MTRNEVETLIKQKYAAGETETGLFDTGMQYVVFDVVNNGKSDELTFTWFDTPRTIDDLLNA